MKVHHRNAIYGGDGNMRLLCSDVDGNGDAVPSNMNWIKGSCPNFAQFLQSVTSRFIIFFILIC